MLKARSYAEERLDREFKRTRDFVNFIFRYQVEGVEYTDSRARVQLYEAFGDRPFKPGDRFEIAYNPEHPQETVFDRQIYDRIFAIGFGLLLMAVGLILAATEWSRMQSRRRLQQVDDNLAKTP